MLEIRPTRLKPAREFVGKYHRHNIPPVGGKFAISCFKGERLCGVAICGRPTARKLDDGATLETVQPEYDIPNMYLCENRAFIESVKTGEKNRSNIENILESARLLDALYQSAEKKQEIVL